jgi:hypothetical protein
LLSITKIGVVFKSSASSCFSPPRKPFLARKGKKLDQLGVNGSTIVTDHYRIMLTLSIVGGFSEFVSDFFLQI